MAASRGASTARPRAADAPIPPPPEKDPKKEEDPKAAAPTKCAKCEADIPTMEPPAKFCPTCGAPVDGAEAPPADGEPAKAMALGRHALALTGTTMPDAARGILAAWKGSHEQLGTVRGELAAARTQIEGVERERVLEQAVRDRVLDPGLAWSYTVNDKGEKVRAFSSWAGPPYEGPDPKRQGEGQSLAQLKAFVSAQSKAPRSPDARPPISPAPIAGVASLTEEQKAHCKRNGLNPEIYAERLAAEQQKGTHR